MTISRNIFQTFTSKNQIPTQYKENINRIIKQNPDWNYQLFDNAELFEFFEENLDPSNFNLIKQINPKYGVILADIFRYLIIYKLGGVYIDIKSTLNIPLSKALKTHYKFLISQWKNRENEEFSGVGLHRDLSHIPGGEFQQWHVVAEPQHPFLKAVLQQVFENIKNYDMFTFGVGRIGVLRLSGPICYTKVIKQILDKHPHEFLDIEDLGFQYSIFRNTADRSAHSRLPNHYSKLNEPLVLKN